MFKCYQTIGIQKLKITSLQNVPKHDTFGHFEKGPRRFLIRKLFFGIVCRKR